MRRLSADRRRSRFVGGLVGLVHDLGLPIIAEGVEREDEAAQLDELTVEFQRGFLACAAPAAAGPAGLLPGPGYGVSTTLRHSSVLFLNVSYICGA